MRLVIYHKVISSLFDNRVDTYLTCTEKNSKYANTKSNSVMNRLRTLVNKFHIKITGNESLPAYKTSIIKIVCQS